MAKQVTNRLHTSASNRDVIQAARKAVAPKFRGAKHKKARHAFFRDCLAVHEANTGMFFRVAKGL